MSLMLGHVTWFLSLGMVDAFVFEFPAGDHKMGISSNDLRCTFQARLGPLRSVHLAFL